MNVSLTKELEGYVQSQVKSGQYSSASEVVREALRAHMRGRLSDDLAARLEASERDIAAGRVVLADEAFFESKRALIRKLAGLA